MVVNAKLIRSSSDPVLAQNCLPFHPPTLGGRKIACPI